jgi:hypothetical protein
VQATQERLEQRIIMLEETVNRLEAENANTLVRCPLPRPFQSLNPAQNAFLAETTLIPKPSTLDEKNPKSYAEHVPGREGPKPYTLKP